MTAYEDLMSTTTPSLPVPSLEVPTIAEISAACSRNQPLDFGDPILARAELPLGGRFFPLGFPLEIRTNAEKIRRAAEKSWGDFTEMFDAEPVRLSIGVTDGGPVECPPTPVFRGRDHLGPNIADTEHFLVSDIAPGCAFGWFTRNSLAHRGYIRYFFLEASAMVLIATRHATALHAACVELDGTGILLFGDSGAGKTTLSYACTQAGWTYITDDASFLVHDRDDLLVVGNNRQFRFRPSAEALFPELRGLPVLQRAPMGKPSLEVATKPLHSVKTAKWARIKHIVFLNRSGHQVHELVSFSAQVARLSMAGSPFISENGHDLGCRLHTGSHGSGSSCAGRCQPAVDG